MNKKINVTLTAGLLSIKSPWNEQWGTTARLLGGRWSAMDKAWEFSFEHGHLILTEFLNLYNNVDKDILKQIEDIKVKLPKTNLTLNDLKREQIESSIKFKINSKQKIFQVFTPYNDEWVTQARLNEGTWNGRDKSWDFPIKQLKVVEGLVELIYGSIGITNKNEINRVSKQLNNLFKPKKKDLKSELSRVNNNNKNKDTISTKPAHIDFEDDKLIVTVPDLNKLRFELKHFEACFQYKNGKHIFHKKDLFKVWVLLKRLFPVVNKDLEKRVLEEIKSSIPPQDKDFTFKTGPRDYQIDLLSYAQTREKFHLGDEMGLGKSKQLIDLSVSRKSQFKHCLVICGVNGLKWNWVNEINKHSNETSRILGQRTTRTGNIVLKGLKERIEDLNVNLDEFFLITNVESLRNEKFVNALKAKCESGEIGQIIFDEIHHCKNPDSKQSKGLLELKTKYHISLSGTPLLNCPLDLYVPLKWLDVEGRTFSRFDSSYTHRDGGLFNQIISYHNLQELQSIFSMVTLRRLKSDVLDLPPKINTVEYIDLAKPQERLYNKIRDQILEMLDSDLLKVDNILVELLRLRQCTGIPDYLDNKLVKNPKFDRLEELIEEQTKNGKKVIVFSNWTTVTDRVYKRLAKYNPAIVTGKVKDREKEITKFKTDSTSKVIIGTTKAMGTGLTLTEAETVIFLDSPWNHSSKEQASDRAHRIGTTNTVNVITLIGRGTIDEKIEQLIEEKKEYADLLVDNKGSKRNKKELVRFLLS